MKTRLEPTDPLAPPPGHPRFPLFDSMRALAAISILVVHAAIFTDGYGPTWYGRFVAHLDIGVPFFFLLSAFLLYRPFVATRVLGAPATPLGTYARRRFVRVLPAYWLALTVAAIVPGMAGAFSGNWWVYYGLLQNYPIYTADVDCTGLAAYRCALPPTWTLAIEVGFYAVLPLFALAMNSIARRWRGRSWLTPELLAVAAISAASVLIQSFPPSTEPRVWLFFSPLGRGWWFAVGLALAAVSVWLQQQEVTPRWVRWVGDRAGTMVVAAAALYAFACLVMLDPFPSLAAPAFTSQLAYVSQYVLFGLIAALVAMPAVFGGRGLYRRALGHPVLAWLGLISYGIFLWQFPVLILLIDHTSLLELWPRGAFPVLVIATFAGSVVCAALSYYGLERPLMRRIRRRPPKGEGEARASGSLDPSLGSGNATTG